MINRSVMRYQDSWFIFSDYYAILKHDHSHNSEL